jgi:hypothetical protein
MLEIKILKVSHGGKDGGEQEAKKLLPHLSKSHVHSPECAAKTEKEALETERCWQIILSSNMSRSYFNSEIVRTNPQIPESQKQYSRKQHEYMFLNKVLMWQLERFTEEESRELIKARNKYEQMDEDSLISLASGKIDSFFIKYWQAKNLRMQITQQRDVHIAKNLESAEENILWKYPKLKNLDTIRYTATIGSRHSPEVYTNMKIQIVDLARTPSPALAKLYEGLNQNKSLEEMKPLMLTYGAWLLTGRGKLPISRNNILEMKYEELIRFIEQNKIL